MVIFHSYVELSEGNVGSQFAIENGHWYPFDSWITHVSHGDDIHLILVSQKMI